MRDVLTSLFFLFLFISCKKEIGNLPIINIYLNDTSTVVLSEIAKSVHPVPLETNKECLLSGITKAKFSEKYIYISDVKHLYQFLRTGKFVTEIGKMGRGPGEFSAITDFCVEQNTGDIYILSYKKLLHYDDHGKLIKEVSITGFPEQIECFDNSLWLNTTQFSVKQADNKYHNISTLAKFDLNSILIDSFIINDIGLEQGFSYVNPNSIFFSFTKQNAFYYYPVVLIEPNVRDTLFKIQNNRLTSAWKLNFGEKIVQLTKNQKQQENITPYKDFRILEIYRTGKYIFSSYSLKDSDFFLCYEINNGKIYNSQIGYEDDFYQTGKIKLKPMNYATNFMYFFKDGIELVHLIEEVNENDNPVLMLVKLKE